MARSSRRLVNRVGVVSAADLRAKIDRRLAEALLDKDEIAQLKEDAYEWATKNLVNLYDHGVDVEGERHRPMAQRAPRHRAVHRRALVAESQHRSARHSANGLTSRGP